MLWRRFLTWRPHPPFFYGWLIVAMAVASSFVAAGMMNLVMAVMLKPITQEMGWTRTMTTGALTAGTLFGGVLAPFLGRIADRYGPRFLLPAGALVVSGAFLALFRVGVLWQFYAAYILGRAIATNTMVGVVPLTAVTNWFFRQRGRALGLTTMALPLGGSVLALLAQYLVTTSSWRTAYLIFGLAAAVLAVPAAIVLRRRPEDLGLLPDGAPVPVSSTTERNVGEKSSREEFNWRLSEATRTRAFWLIIASFVIALLANGAIGFHQVAYFTDMGLSSGVAATVLSTYALSGAVSNVLWGFLTERFPVRACNVLTLVLSSLCLLLLILARNPLTAYLFAVLFGLAARGEGSLVEIMVSQYFGRGSFGAIVGFMVPFQMLGLGVGPLLAAATYDLTGSYHGVFTLFIFTYLVAASLIYLARRPPLPERAAERERLAAEGDNSSIR